MADCRDGRRGVADSGEVLAAWRLSGAVLASPSEPIAVQREPVAHSNYHGNVNGMALAQSKITAQGQISVPAEVRRKLGVGPGAVLEWDEEGGQIVVRRAGRYTSEEINRVLFPDGPPPAKSLEELKSGVRRYV